LASLAWLKIVGSGIHGAYSTTSNPRFARPGMTKKLTPRRH
jgi:hypothetical protein